MSFLPSPASIRQKVGTILRRTATRRSMLLLLIAASIAMTAHAFSLGGFRVVIRYVLAPHLTGVLLTWLFFLLLFGVGTLITGGRAERGTFLGIALVLIFYMNVYDLPRLLTTKSLVLNPILVAAALLLAIQPWGRRIYWVANAILVVFTFVTYPKDTIHTSGFYREIQEPSPAPQNAPNLLVICVDTLRADHLGCYGYERNISPNLDRFASEGTLFLDASSQGSWTQPSTASYLTSRHPSEVGVRYSKDYLSVEYPTMASWWSDHGYNTYAVVANPFLAPDLGKCRGFREVVFDSAMTVRLRYLFPFYLVWRTAGVLGFQIMVDQDSNNADQVVHFFKRWYDTGPEEPWLVYLHFMDPHTPYLPPEPFDGKWGNGRADQYDAEIEYWDTWFGELKQLLGPAWDDTVIAVLADHGEHLGEDGLWGHVSSLYQELLHVPFIFRCPGRIPAGIREELVGLIDMLPTLAGLSGIPANPEWLGRDLFAENASPEQPPRISPYFSESHYYFPDPQNTWTGVRRGPIKIIHGENRNGTFDLEKDPTEDVDIGTIEDLDQVLSKYEDAMNQAYTGTSSELSDALTRQLRALGYMK